MPVRIGINGFGRVGRLLARQLLEQSELQLSHINDPALSPELAAHLLNFDSVDGPWHLQAEAGASGITTKGHTTSMSQEHSIEAVGWGDKAEIVVDCSGRIKQGSQAQGFLDAGVRKVIVSAPISGVPMFVLGVNADQYRPELDHILSNASCTTNCLATVASVLHEEFCIRHGLITTIHALTNDQALLDEGHEDWRRARAAGLSLIPTTSGFAKAIDSVIPALAGQLQGYAVRAPVVNASLLDCAFVLEQPASAATINAAFERASQGRLQGILAVESRPLVSADYRGNRHSAVIDSALTQVVDHHFAKVVAWYDNETGYVSRLHELIRLVAGSLP